MTMFNITDGKNNISRDKPVEHIDLVIGLMVSGCPHNCPHNCPHARPRTPANVAWCVCTNIRTFSPQVRVHARAVRRVERTV